MQPADKDQFRGVCRGSFAQLYVVQTTGRGFAMFLRGILEEAPNAVRMIGDHQLQRQVGRVPNPNTFTHGTSAQRARCFDVGFDTGKIGLCDTFLAERL